GKRNNVILETIYRTRLRVSVCQSLTLYDIDFSIGTMIVTGKGRKERYVAFGSFAETALKAYINDGRQKLLATSGDPTKSVFLNARGHPLTTRGIRLILSNMVEKAALTVHVHPHKLRHTFATH